MKKLKLIASAIIVSMTALFISCEPQEKIIPVSGIEVCHSQMEFNIGESDSLTVNVLPLNASNRAYTLVADKEGIIDIKDNKFITALAAGEVNVTATSAEGEYTAVCKVIVNEAVIPVESISFKSDNPLALVEGDQKAFEVEVLPANASNKAYSLQIIDTEVATLDAATNTITAVKEGKTSIIATTKDGGFTAELKVIVTDRFINVESITIEQLAEPLAQGDSVALVVKVLPEEATDKSFVITSSDSSVVDVNGQVVYGISAGTATVTATSNDGSKTGTLEITVPATTVTVAEFIAAEVSELAWYEITGTITNIVNTTYGNLYIKDATGETFIYGVKTTKDGEKGKFKDELSEVTIGDEITIITQRGEYNGAAQGTNAYYVKHTDNAYPYAEGTDEDFISLVNYKDSINKNNKAYTYTAVINGATYEALKLGSSSGQGMITLSAAQLGITAENNAVAISFYAKAWADANTEVTIKVNEEGEEYYEAEKVAMIVAQSEPLTNNTQDLGVINYSDDDKYTVYLTDLKPTSTVIIETPSYAWGENDGYRVIIAGLEAYSMVFAGEFVKATTNDMIISIDAPDSYIDNSYGYEEPGSYVINWAPAAEIEDLTDEELFHRELIMFYESYEDYHSEWYGYPETVSSFAVAYGDEEDFSCKSIVNQIGNRIKDNTDYIIYIYAVKANDDYTATRISNIVRIPATTEAIQMVDMTFEFGIDRVQDDAYSDLSAYPYTNPSLTDQMYTSYIINEKSLQYYKGEDGKPATEMTEYVARKLLEEVIQSNNGGWWPVDPETWQFYGYHAVDMYSAVTVYAPEELGQYNSNVSYIIAAGLNQYLDICTEVQWYKLDVTGLENTDVELKMAKTAVEGKEYTYNITVTPDDASAMYNFGMVTVSELEAYIDANYYYDYEVSTYVSIYVNEMLSQFADMDMTVEEAVPYLLQMNGEFTTAPDDITVTEDTYVMAYSLYPKSGAINGLVFELLEGPAAEPVEGGTVTFAMAYAEDWYEDGSQMMISFYTGESSDSFAGSFLVRTTTPYKLEGTYTIEEYDFQYYPNGNDGDNISSVSGTATFEKTGDDGYSASYKMTANVTFDDNSTYDFVFEGKIPLY